MIIVVFQTSIDNIAPDFGQAKSLLKVSNDLLGVKLLAGEDVDIEVGTLGESVDANMALRYKDKSRDAPIFGFGADVLGNLWGRDLCHPDFRGISIQELVDEINILHFLGITTVAIDNQVHCSHPLLVFEAQKLTTPAWVVVKIQPATGSRSLVLSHCMIQKLPLVPPVQILFPDPVRFADLCRRKPSVAAPPLRSDFTDPKYPGYIIHGQ